MDGVAQFIKNNHLLLVLRIKKVVEFQNKMSSIPEKRYSFVICSSSKWNFISEKELRPSVGDPCSKVKTFFY